MIETTVVKRRVVVRRRRRRIKRLKTAEVIKIVGKTIFKGLFVIILWVILLMFLGANYSESRADSLTEHQQNPTTLEAEKARLRETPEYQAASERNERILTAYLDWQIKEWMAAYDQQNQLLASTQSTSNQ